MSKRRKPAKPPPKPAHLICPGQDFDRYECGMRLQPVESDCESAQARALRAFDEACARAYWLALLRD